MSDAEPPPFAISPYDARARAMAAFWISAPTALISPRASVPEVQAAVDEVLRRVRVVAAATGNDPREAAQAMWDRRG